MLTEAQRRFILAQRIGYLATADASGTPHVVPVCFVLAGTTAYIVIDQKPKRVPPARVKRVRNIQENPRCALLVDTYDEDWSKLGWIALQGRAELITGGVDHAEALALLRARYEQYRAMDLDEAPVIGVRLERAIGWGVGSG